MRKIEQKKNWTLTPSALDRLLNWLDEGTPSDGEKYLEMRRRLLAYFDRKNCTSPEELVDETLNRVIRRLEEEGGIESDTPAKYCYIVARFVFMEYLREAQEQDRVLKDSWRQTEWKDLSIAAVDDEKRIKETMLNCLDHCADNLERSDRDLILCYYVGEKRVKIENRRALAESLGITMNALSIRACRIRTRLETCVRQCANKGDVK